MLFVILWKQFAENVTKSYHFYKVIVVLHIDDKILGIGLTVHPANKNEKFDPYQILSSIAIYM